MQKLNHCVFDLKYHLILVTKYRRKVIRPPLSSDLEAALRSAVAKWECSVSEYNGEPDHVHLLVTMNPKVCPATFIGNVKSVSSRRMFESHEAYLRGFFWYENTFWSRSYCLISVGGAPLSVLKQYIEQQAGFE